MASPQSLLLKTTTRFKLLEYTHSKPTVGFGIRLQCRSIGLRTTFSFKVYYMVVPCDTHQCVEFDPSFSWAPNSGRAVFCRARSKTLDRKKDTGSVEERTMRTCFATGEPITEFVESAWCLGIHELFMKLTARQDRGWLR